MVEEQQRCDKRDEEFGRGQNTELGWNDPLLPKTSWPK
jgi:hypothetical protein